MPPREQYQDGDLDRRVDVLESWRTTHDIWAGDKAERLTRLEVQQSGIERWRQEMRETWAEAAKVARDQRKFAIAQIVALITLAISVWMAKH